MVGFVGLGAIVACYGPLLPEWSRVAGVSVPVSVPVSPLVSAVPVSALVSAVRRRSERSAPSTSRPRRSSVAPSCSPAPSSSSSGRANGSPACWRTRPRPCSHRAALPSAPSRSRSRLSPQRRAERAHAAGELAPGADLGDEARRGRPPLRPDRLACSARLVRRGKREDRPGEDPRRPRRSRRLQW